MKRIITHFIGNVSFDSASLQSIAESLERRHDYEDGHPSTTAQDPILANDYSLDPLSTNTMRTSTLRIGIGTVLT